MSDGWLGPPASSPAGSMDREAAHRGWRSRGYIPHCDAAGLTQHIVFGLTDALPRGAKPTSALHGDRILDGLHGSCVLRSGDCAAVVERALLHADGERYRLIAWCIMPNHVHVIVQQMEGGRLDAIVQAWKSASAHSINNHLSRRGRLWRREYFDRFMRGDGHLATSIAYVEDNPVQAKLAANAVEWPWSSARFRDTAGEDAGGPRK